MTTDFLGDLIADSSVVSRDLTIRGKTGTVFAKRISAGERASLVAGQKVTAAGQGSASVEIDVGENVKAQHMLVHFAICDDKGNKRFKTLKEVQAIEADIVAALYAFASEINTEGDAGKA
jgi:hypothetical protein